MTTRCTDMSTIQAALDELADEIVELRALVQRLRPWARYGRLVRRWENPYYDTRGEELPELHPGDIGP